MARKSLPPSFSSFWQSLDLAELQSLIEEVKRDDADAIARAVVFSCAESFGCWHNRARAKLCRHFKNHPPADGERKQLVNAIVGRLIEGRFYEQFKDQLAMAIRFSPEQLEAAAEIAIESERDYICRYGLWVQNRVRSHRNE